MGSQNIFWPLVPGATLRRANMRVAANLLAAGSLGQAPVAHSPVATGAALSLLRLLDLVDALRRDRHDGHVPEAQLNTESRDTEVRLADALTACSESNSIVGRDAGPRLQRLPSSVYWTGPDARALGLSQLARQSFRPLAGSRRFAQYIKRRRRFGRHIEARRLPPDHRRDTIAHRLLVRQPANRTAHDVGAQRNRRGLSP